MRGIFTEEEYRKHNKLIWVSIAIAAVIGGIIGYLLDPTGESYLKFIRGIF